MRDLTRASFAKGGEGLVCSVADDALNEIRERGIRLFRCDKGLRHVGGLATSVC
jgi:hypothetical protein